MLLGLRIVTPWQSAGWGVQAAKDDLALTYEDLTA